MWIIKFSVPYHYLEYEQRYLQNTWYFLNFYHHMNLLDFLLHNKGKYMFEGMTKPTLCRMLTSPSFQLFYREIFLK